MVAVILGFVVLCPTDAAPNKTVEVIDLRGLSGTQGLTLSIAAGLLSRDPDSPLVFPKMLPNDDLWLASVIKDYPDVRFTNTSADSLLQQAVQSGAVKSTIIFSEAEPWTFVTLLSLCALHKALPLPNTPALSHSSTEVVVIQRPDLVAQGFLADLVAQRSLFTFWLPDMCTAGSPSNALYQIITDKAHSEGHMLTLMGYFPSQEVVASCSRLHTEVSLVSDFSSSLSFWSRLPPLSALGLLSTWTTGQPSGVSQHRMSQPQLPPQPPVQDVRYNPDHTYVAVIVSDGDNMQMAFNWDREHMDQRVAACAADPSYLGCPPLSWTISNHLADYAPYALQWYYRQAASTGQDSFLLGPSGAGFLHPSLIDASDPLVQVFINQTLDALKLLGASAWVQWDEYDNHARRSGTASLEQARGTQRLHQPLQEEAMQAYVSRFKGTGVAVFSPITPYLPPWVDDGIPTFTEWVRWFASKPTKEVADFLNGEGLKGELGFMYMIIDIGMDRLRELMPLLEAHVELVGYRELVQLAHQKREYERNHV
ncbi:hypothetical protein WJX73_001371 [Symbiochloris irregularis]|uniref:GxGYxYP putative glycoside hydrolase C-terminal domain-containing protein n=1 Tax=Symbiochloris irregularis TaxID=706552 RepID=A0AAW1NPJ6_9CHLO